MSTKATFCQICSTKRPCRLVKCDTKYSHAWKPVMAKLTGHQGTAVLSVCPECEEDHKKE